MRRHTSAVGVPGTTPSPAATRPGLGTGAPITGVRYDPATCAREGASYRGRRS
jgi:hypothetical protein